MYAPSAVPVSVIIPVYNCEATVERAIASALRQGPEAHEIIVVDDASTDRSPAIVETLAKRDRRVVPIRLPGNGGVGLARNVGLANATGDWVAVLDADDWFRPERLRTMLLASKGLDADLLCDNLRLFDHSLGREVGVTRFGSRRSATPITVQMLFDLDHALRRHHLGLTKPMVRAAFLKDSGLVYDSRFHVGEDFLFLAEAVLNRARAFILPSADYVYVHRIAPSTRLVSPQSRADTGFSDIRRSCSYLAGRYWNRMDRRGRRGLARKRRSISDWILYMELLGAVRERQLRKAIKIVARRPAILAIKIVTIRNRLLDLAMILRSGLRLWTSARRPQRRRSFLFWKLRGKLRDTISN
jgi:succinoglycan biosynthesis protein ExoO